MGTLKVWQTSLAVFVVVLYWILVLALPDRTEPWPWWARSLLAIAGVGALVAGLVTARKGLARTGDDKAELFALGSTLVLVALVLLISTFLTSRGLALTPERRIAVGLGGAALAGLAYGTTRFDTMRAAASVPVVILLIGVVAWPNARDLIETSVRESIITWMSVVLGANGLAEAVKQVGESNAKAKAGGTTQASEVTSSGDLHRGD